MPEYYSQSINDASVESVIVNQKLMRHYLQLAC